jgi:hypothetical protein
LTVVAAEVVIAENEAGSVVEALSIWVFALATTALTPVKAASMVV